MGWLNSSDQPTTMSNLVLMQELARDCRNGVARFRGGGCVYFVTPFFKDPSFESVLTYRKDNVRTRDVKLTPSKDVDIRFDHVGSPVQLHCDHGFTIGDIVDAIIAEYVRAGRASGDDLSDIAIDMLLTEDGVRFDVLTRTDRVELVNMQKTQSQTYLLK